MDTAYGGCIRKSRQIGQRWRQDHDWLCLSFLAISDYKLLGRAKSDFHAFSKDAQARPPGLNPRTLSTRINTMSHFSEILRSMPSILSRKLFPLFPCSLPSFFVVTAFSPSTIIAVFRTLLSSNTKGNFFKIRHISESYKRFALSAR